MIVGFHTQQLKKITVLVVLTAPALMGHIFPSVLSLQTVCLKEIVAAVLHTGRSVASLVSDTSAASTQSQSSALGSDSHSIVTKGKILLGYIFQRESDSVSPHHSRLISNTRDFCLETGLENRHLSIFVVGAA